jgi:hypothetical protein
LRNDENIEKHSAYLLPNRENRLCARITDISWISLYQLIESFNLMFNLVFLRLSTSGVRFSARFEIVPRNSFQHRMEKGVMFRHGSNRLLLLVSFEKCIITDWTLRTYPFIHLNRTALICNDNRAFKKLYVRLGKEGMSQKPKKIGAT